MNNWHFVLKKNIRLSSMCKVRVAPPMVRLTCPKLVQNSNFFIIIDSLMGEVHPTIANKSYYQY